MTARVTPYELLLAPLAEHFFPAITAEAEARGADTSDRDAFLLLGHAGAALKEMLPDDAPPAALEQCAELLWQGWRFQELGARLYVISEDAAARLTTAEYDAGAWRFAAPPACYIQLPYQRVWARVVPDAAWEPLDGWFAAARPLAAGAHELRLLAVLGLRRDRPGVSLVPHHTVIEEGAAAARLAHPWRDGSSPFASTIPGGDRMGYRTLATASELEALALRALHAIEAGARVLERAEGGDGTNASAFPHVLVP